MASISETTKSHFTSGNIGFGGLFLGPLLPKNRGPRAGPAEQGWDSREHFFGAAAEAMRRILVESARRRASLKRGAETIRVELDDRSLVYEGQTFDLLVLDEALDKLEEHDPDAAKLVKLRFFAGLGHQEAAEVMSISRRAADRCWALARAWLFRELGEN
jgi:RNA polymerase sigma factor (TIGR02999 family)